MTLTETLLWYLAALIGLGGSAICSGLETGIYTLNRIRLHVLAHIPRPDAVALDELLRDPNSLLGTLLISNNVFNYLATLAIAALLEAAGYVGWWQVAINAAILTPLLFVFGEVVPKDLFRSHTDRLTYYFAAPLRWTQRLLTFTGILPLLRLVSRAIRHVLKAKDVPMSMLHPRRVVTQLMREGVGHGVISPYQSDMIERVLELGRLTVEDVMTPWHQVHALRTTHGTEQVWQIANRVPHTRMPLLDERGKVVGVVHVEDVLREGGEPAPPAAKFAGPVVEIRPESSLRAALLQMQHKRVSLAVVVDRGRPVGIVTIKDLVEPIVGELDVW